MGYTTYFTGSIDVVPPLDKGEIEYLTKFSQSRRMKRTKGPYFVEGSGFRGQEHESDVTDHNTPPDGQPGLWCQWIPTEDGTQIVWDGGEKFYESHEWMKYLIEHFLKPGALAIGKVAAITGGHICNGEIEAQGEESDDKWMLVVENNAVYVRQGHVEYGPKEAV